MKQKNTSHPKKRTNWVRISVLVLAIYMVGSAVWAGLMIHTLRTYRSPLASDPPKPLTLTSSIPLCEKVVMIIVDALRYDTSVDASIMPYLNSLRQNGANAKMSSRPPSYSAPGWTTILTGAWPDINDAEVLNPIDPLHPRAFTQDDIFAAANRAGLRTSLSGYIWFDQMLENSHVSSIFTVEGEDQYADRLVVDHALPWLEQDYQLILIHLDQVDYAGHYEGGPESIHWAEAARRVDQLLEEIIRVVNLDTTTVIIISDHGQINRGGHGGAEVETLLEPFVAIGNGIIPGTVDEIQMVDIAPTISVLLGIEVPASNQGRPLYEFLDIKPELAQDWVSHISTQQELMYASYVTAINEEPDVLDVSSTVTTYQIKLEEARMRRLSNERVWRNMVAMFIIVILVYIFVIRQKIITFWHLLGGFLYISIFNFRYIVIDQYTYSYSSIQPTTEFIFYIFVTTAIAFCLSWITAMFGSRAFRQKFHQAVFGSAKVTWAILFVLLIPILLNFAVNGFITTWTLPEVQIHFLGLFALVQTAIVAGTGLLLTGITAVVAKKRHRQAP